MYDNVLHHSAAEAKTQVFLTTAESESTRECRNSIPKIVPVTFSAYGCAY